MQAIAVTVGALVVGTALSEATDSTGPLGPAGVFFVMVLVVTALAGVQAGLATASLGGLILWVVFTDPRWSFHIAEPDALADLAAYAVVSSLLCFLLSRLIDAREQTHRALAHVDSMVQNSPVGMAFIDRDLRFVEINDALAAMNEQPAADLIGRRVDELAGISGTEIPDLIRSVFETGVSRLDVPFAGIGRQSGRDVRVAAGYYPVRGADGTIDGVGIVVRETTAEHQRDLLFDRVSRLQDLAAALASAGAVEEVAAAAVRMIQLAVGARAASFCCLDDDDDDDIVKVVGSIGYTEDVLEEFASFDRNAPVPLAEAIRTGEPVLCGTRAEALERFPDLADSMTLGDSRAIAALPLRGESAVLGAIGISFYDERTFDVDQSSFLVAIATQCATAYERAVAFEAERAARHSAEAANRRLAYLSEATAVLSQSLDPETTMQRLAELAVPTLGDWCAVHLVDGDFAVPVAMASENPEATAMVRALSDRNPVRIDAPAGLGAVIRTGEPVVVRRVTMDAVRASTDASEVVDLLSRLRSIAIVPMTFHGEVIGAVTLSNTTDRDLEDADVNLASELAARAAQAVTNARLYQERALVATTIQASLLPPSPAIIPGVDIATRFVSGAEGLDIGGDFYDVFRLGTIEQPAPTWAIVIGDVRGKGVDAAAISGIARATIRATALDETSPSAMLSRLNQVLLTAAHDDRFAVETGEPRFCTVCVVTVTPALGGADLVVAVGGHPLPYIVRGDGTVEVAGEAGGLIGVMPAPAISDTPMRLGPGDALVMFTDGVTERHAGRMYFDDEGLATVLGECSGLDATLIAERVELASRGFVEEAPTDDLAIVVARVPPSGASVAARVELSSDEQAAAQGRRFVADTLAVLGITEVDIAVLLTSELVTNGLLHGTAPFLIEVVPSPDRVRVSVIDAHADLPFLRSTSPEGEHGRGLLLVDALAARWGVDAHPPGKAVWFEVRR